MGNALGNICSFQPSKYSEMKIYEYSIAMVRNIHYTTNIEKTKINGVVEYESNEA